MNPSHRAVVDLHNPATVTLPEAVTVRPGALAPVRIRLLWHAQAQFAGYLVAEHEALGAQRGIAIVNSPIDFSRGPIDALLGGDVDFAVASPSHLLESEHASQLVMVLAIQQQSALAYPAHRARGIEHPRDLVGRRVGVWPGREHLELRWMLHRAGADPEAVQWVPMADTVGPFLAGAVECAQMTVYHELAQVIEQLGGASQVTLFRAVDWNAGLLKDGLVTTRRAVRESPERVQAVVDTVLDAWQIAFEVPSRALDACLRANAALNRHHQAMQLESIRELAQPRASIANGLGYPDPWHLECAARAMRDLGDTIDPALIEGTVDIAFWSRAQARTASAA